LGSLGYAIGALLAVLLAHRLQRTTCYSRLETAATLNVLCAL
jgi:hypothetical protein